jgi:hypothetical protein
MAGETSRSPWHGCYNHIDLAVDVEGYLRWLTAFTKTDRFTNIPRGASNGAEMAVSRTLEPDPGHAGVGTETGAQGSLFFFALPGSPFVWRSPMNISVFPDDTLWRAMVRGSILFPD